MRWIPVSRRRTADVHDARMPAPGEDHQAPVRHVQHGSLVVEDERVSLPGALAIGLVDREAGLSGGQCR